MFFYQNVIDGFHVTYLFWFLYATVWFFGSKKWGPETRKLRKCIIETIAKLLKRNTSSVPLFYYLQLQLLYLQLHFINIFFKGATKFYFTHYLHMVIILFNTGLYKSAFSTFSFGKLAFCISVAPVFSVSSLLFWIRCYLHSRAYHICIIIVEIGVRWSVISFSLYYENLIKHAFRKVLSFKNFVYKEKCEKLTKWKSIKNVFKK